jgi:DNA-binding SARP family transcriptional activator
MEVDRSRKAVSMVAQLDLSLLGGVQICRGKEPICGFRSNKAAAMLCYLATTTVPAPRPLIADLFWPDFAESHANDSLRVTLSNLRSVVGSHLIITRYTVAFNPDSPHHLDVREFQEAIKHHGSGDSIERLRRAADLYRGDFLAGFHVQDAPAFEQWASVQQMQLHDLAVRTFHTLIAHYAPQGSAGRALALNYGSRLLALEPWEESTHQLLMLLLAASGQPAAANKHFEVCRKILREESGAEPSVETVEMAARIHRGALTTEEAIQQIAEITMRFGTLPSLVWNTPLPPARPSASTWWAAQV